jgi:beta-lactam-binding protein with PASTA domain
MQTDVMQQQPMQQQPMQQQPMQPPMQQPPMEQRPATMRGRTGGRRERVLAIVALVVGVVALVVSGIALWKANDTPKTKAPTGITTTPSNGQVALPNLAGKQGIAAASILKKANLKFTVVQATSPTVAKGLVISQKPAAGTKVPAGSSVQVTVSKGPS